MIFAAVEHDFSIIHNRNDVAHMLVANRGPPEHTVATRAGTVEQHDFFWNVKKNLALP